MTDEDESGDESGDEGGDVSVEDLETRLDEAADALEAAETEADLDDVEADLDAIADDLEAADLPESDDEDEADPAEELESRLSDLRDDLEEARGPYAEDVTATVEAAQSTLTGTEWTEQGEGEIVDAVDDFLAAAGDALDEDLGSADADADPETLSGHLDDAGAAIEAADLDADDDAETIAALVEAADGLQTGLDESQEWDDLLVHEQLLAQGFYDVLGHYKDFPPEWAALKEHEKRGNVDMVLLALDSLDSDFMERHCLEAITRMGDAGAYDAMFQRAEKRDRPGIKALGKMGPDAADAVETLVEYVDTDSDPQLQKVTFKALGEIGDERATQPLANKLEMENDQVRPHAARALGLIGDTRAVDPLADTLADDENDNVRAAAAWALRQIGTRAALEAAAEYTDEHAPLVQAEAEKARDALDESAVEA